MNVEMVNSIKLKNKKILIILSMYIKWILMILMIIKIKL